MLDQERRRLQAAKESGTTLRLLEEAFAQPFLTARGAAKVIGTTPQSAKFLLAAN